jgi:drug/metabolite transporter (DMT)-like permease
MSSSTKQPERWQIISAFLAIYLIWGSTYIAIRFALESFPVFFMASTRFLVAGLLLYAWARARGAARPDFAHWKQAAFIGSLLLVIGNSGIAFAEKTVPSGIVSLLVAMVPVFVALLEWLRPKGVAPSPRRIFGLLTGIVGMAILTGPSRLTGGSGFDLFGVSCVLFGSLAWSFGSLHARTARLPEVPLLGTAMQMLCAGAIMGIFSLIGGETHKLQLTSISVESWCALAYLITFGSIVGFSAYVWLLKMVSPSRVSTYAYVNPVVAVFLGWALAGEALSMQTMLAAVVILVAVWIITGARDKTTAVEVVFDDIAQKDENAKMRGGAPMPGAFVLSRAKVLGHEFIELGISPKIPPGEI